MQDETGLELGQYAADDFLFQGEPTILRLHRPEVIGHLARPPETADIEIAADYIVKLKNVRCVPGQAILRDKTLLPDSFRRYDPTLAHRLLRNAPDGTFTCLYARDRPSKLTTPSFFLDGEHVGHFGHFLLETLPRLWPYDRLDFSGLKFITSAPLHTFIVDLLRPFGIERGQLVQIEAPVEVDELYVASQSYVLERRISPRAFKVWNKIAEYFRSGEAGSSRIYVSRSKVKQRQLVNEADVEDIFRGRGFVIIHPERMSIAEQVSAFQSADIIAGPSGSGMYNCVFCRPEAQRIVLASNKFIIPNDALLSSQSSANLVYLSGTVLDEEPGMFAKWCIDADMVRSYLDKHLL